MPSAVRHFYSGQPMHFYSGVDTILTVTVTMPGGCVITTGEACLYDKKKGQIGGSDIILDGGHGGSAGKTA